MIFYFSGTGNSKWVADKLAEKTDEHLYFIPDELSTSCIYHLTQGERIGFVFPVHGWRPPKIVRAFIEKLSFGINNEALSQGKQASTSQPYVYAICTAGDTIGETMDILKQDLLKKKLYLRSGFSLIMPESYVGLPFMDVDNQENENRKIENSSNLLNGYISNILLKKPNIWDLTLGKWPKINSRVLGGVFHKYLITDNPFWVDSNKCVRCGICADVCPVHDINGGLGHEPDWKHDLSCLTCFSCYHHCPHHAIQYGRQTKKKGQYFFAKHH